jgi:tetratricopeptide (TPR) repeat protein
MERAMKFRDINHLSGEYLHKKEKQKLWYFPPYTPSHEQETSFAFPDKGKKALTPQEVANEEEWLKSIPIGENGKRMDRQIILSERYDKDNPGLAGGSVELICLWLLKQAGQFAVKEVLGWMKKMILKEESAEQMLDRFIGSHCEAGLRLLEDATKLVGGKNREEEWIRMAIEKFALSSSAEGTDFGKAKSMFCTAVCYHLLGEYPNAKDWFIKARNKGDGLRQREVKEINDFVASLAKLLNSGYPNLPALGYPSRLAISSSGSGSERYRDQEEPRLANERQKGEQQKKILKELIQYHFDSGYKHWLSNELQNAVNKFSKILELDINHARAREMRGRAYLARRDNGKALDDLKQVPPDTISVSGLVSRGVAHRRLGKNYEAKTDFSLAIEKDSMNAEAFARRGETYLAMRQPEKALLDLDRAINLDCKQHFALTYRGQLYLERGEIDKALPDFSRAIQQSSKNALALLGRGRIHYRLKEYPKAHDDFDKIIRFFGNHALAYAERGRANQAMGKLKDAFDDYTNALTLDSSLDWVKPALDEVRPLLAEQQAREARSL